MQNAELGMNERVTFLGQLDTAALRNEIQKAWAVVVPSRVPETFGYGVLESLAQGTPVIASDSGALPELINELGGGKIVKPESVSDLASAVIEVTTNQKRWQDEATRARTSIKTDFSPDAYYKKLLDLYTQLT